MVKEISVTVKNGDVDPESAPIRGSVEMRMGAQATSDLVAELSGKYGEEFGDRPLFVATFGSEDSAESFKTSAESWIPSQILPDALPLTD